MRMNKEARARSLPQTGIPLRLSDILLNDTLHLIPITRIDGFDGRIEELLDLIKEIPLLTGRDECHGNANTAESTRTADTVEVGLVVCVSGLAGVVQFGDLLCVH